MAIVLDLIASGLAGGFTGSDMDDQNKGSCTNCCQIFIAIDPYLAGTMEEVQGKWDARVKRADEAHPLNEAHPVSCPGEGTIRRRKDNMKNGVQVNEEIWAEICRLAGVEE